jgi:gluconokinase
MTQLSNDNKCVVAVDIGTTSTKTLVIDRMGKVIASHFIEYPLHTPKPDIAEQDPDEIFAAVLTGIRVVKEKSGIASREVLAVSFSSAMHSLIAVDEHLNPLTQCITWADNRGSRYAGQLKADDRGHRIYLATGTPIHPMSPLLKLMWMREFEPELFKKVFKFIGIKEYVFAKLFDRYVIDYSIASATGLFNLEQLDWDPLAMETAGISKERLSEPVNTTFKLQGMNTDYADQMGLDRETPFIVGASDGVLANLGIGAVEPGVYAVTIGTSGAVRGIVKKPLTDSQGRLFCYALTEDNWVIGGAINNGGIMFRWVRDQLATKETEEAIRLGLDPYGHLTEIAQGVTT